MDVIDDMAWSCIDRVAQSQNENNHELAHSTWKVSSCFALTLSWEIQEIVRLNGIKSSRLAFCQLSSVDR